jgi:Glycosyltransferase family 28 C-terminal domain
LPTIWCAISGHGFGHAAQVVPVLNQLGRHVPDLTAILRTTASSSFFQERLAIPWSLQSVQQDVGCVQRGPLQIDVPATWEGYRQFHATWERRLAAETTAIRAAAPRMILADPPYLAISAGKQAGIPSVLLANLTWSEVLRSLDESASEHESLLESIRRSYGEADMALRIAPGLPLSDIPKVFDIGPIAEPAQSQRDQLHSCLGIPTSEPVVLVGFGGIPLENLPWHEMDQMSGYQFLVDGVPPRPSSRVHSLSALPFSFKTALASADLVITKPGYGTIVEAVALGLPVVYVRRYNFADETPLVEFLHRYGTGEELSRDDFFSGNWRPALEALANIAAAVRRPLMTGAAEAAKSLLQYFH